MIRRLNIPRKTLDKYTAQQVTIMTAAKAEAAEWLTSLNWAANVAELEANIDATIALTEYIVGKYGAATAENAATMSEAVTYAQTGKMPKAKATGSTVNNESIQKSIKYAAGSLFERAEDGTLTPNVDAFLERVNCIIVRETNRSAADTMKANDNRHIRWARVCEGGDPCPECLAYEAMGYVDDIDELMDFHDNCMCQLVPGYEGTSIT